MSFDTLGPGALNYQPCQYGTSKLVFRGPKRALDAEYVVFLGGTNTYGKFIPKPFPDLVEDGLGLSCINMGCPNAGIDLMLNEPVLRDAAARARVTVVQIVSPRNMSNRMYTVHPRRNDRFLKPSELMEQIYREVDFAEFNFTKHMLQQLNKVSADRFRTVVDELRQAWSARMRLLLGQIPGSVVLLWISDHEPGKPYDVFGTDPWFVTREMIEDLMAYDAKYVEVVASDEALAAGTEGMVFSELELPVAERLLGPKVHEEAARALTTTLREILN